MIILFFFFLLRETHFWDSWSVSGPVSFLWDEHIQRQWEFKVQKENPEVFPFSPALQGLSRETETGQEGAKLSLIKWR